MYPESRDAVDSACADRFPHDPPGPRREPTPPNDPQERHRTTRFADGRARPRDFALPYSSKGCIAPEGGALMKGNDHGL
jgi:hypothetical protein